MKRIAILTLAMIATPALAQQQVPNPAANPQEQIERTIGNLYVANINLTAQLQAVQIRLSMAEARVKELEPKPADPKPAEQ